MTVHKLTAGDGYTYLSRQVAAHDTTEPDPGGLERYYSEKGEAPGRWMGRGLDGLEGPQAGAVVTATQMLALFGQGRHPDAVLLEDAALAAGSVPLDVDRASRLGRPYRVFDAANEFRRRCAVEFREHNARRDLPSDHPVEPHDRARIRTALAIEMFTETFGRGPLNPRELSGHLARISRQATTAVAGYDLTFSPVKSISTLWAIAPPEVAAVIERAHADAVADVLTWLEEHASYTRTGRNGVAQVDVRGLIAASYTHRDSRAGDPDLHTHLAVSNKVQALDGRWLALDGRAVHKNAVAASERYNTRVEAFIVDRLGVRFLERDQPEPGKRKVREIVGIDGPLPRTWSSRRSAIDGRRAELATAFQVDHGRPPTAKEAIALAQQANLETRNAKHEPRSYSDQRAAWRAEANAVLGGEAELNRYVGAALLQSGHRPVLELDEHWLRETARLVVQNVATSRATWQEAHVRAEAERQVRTGGIRFADLDRAVEGLVETALSHPFSVRLGSDAQLPDEPAALRRTDGSSAFEVAGGALYSSSDVLAAERAVLAAAARRDGQATTAAAVDEALRAAETAGMPLNPGQTAMVRDLAGSGSRVQLALAPAGTGKTTALRTLASAWRIGGGDVVGLAPSAAASAVLSEQLDARTDTVAKLVHASRTGIDVPDWLPSIGPRTLVLVDEAGSAGTPDLAAVVEIAVEAGASVRLIGDDRQLGAVGAGGLLRDLAQTHGAVRLSQVVRFVDRQTGAPNRAEGAASLALRDGDPTALAYYADRNRLHVGDLSTCVEDTYSAWQQDRAAGLEPVMLAPTRDLVHQLNERARNERLGRLAAVGPQAALADSSCASAGDVVITRRNRRTLAVGPTDWVRNGDRWTVGRVHPSGALDVVHLRNGKRVTLPPDYVQAHVTLGYASTVHSAQGVTADSSYTILTGDESRQLLYVALTRGRHENHVFLATSSDGDPHTAITRDALLPPTAVDVLSRVLAHDDAPVSATSSVADLDDPARRLSEGVDRYVHALTTAAQQRVGTAGLAEIDVLAETALPGLTDADAYPALRSRLAMLALAGSGAGDVLGAALADPRGLADARDVAAVLDWRVDPADSGGGPLPWLPGIPDPLTSDPEWAGYLAARAEQISTLASAVAAAASEWTPATAPPWAKPLLADPELVGDLSVWRAALGIGDAPAPSGPPRLSAVEGRTRRALDSRVDVTVGRAGLRATEWVSLAKGIDTQIVTDPFWPLLSERLTTASDAGADVRELLASVTRHPLPDEQPAAALWWRLADHVPPVIAASDGPSPVRPSWTDGPTLVTEPRVSAELPSSAEWPDVEAAHGGADNRQGGLTGPASDEARSEDAGAYLPLRADPSRDRLLQLNRQAADFFAAQYPTSWAPGYLSRRLGSDPRKLGSHVIGYAPDGWSGLTDHLRAAGAEDDEILRAGLGTRASTGRVIDRFRDRVVFGIQGDDGIAGWIGRRNPTRDDGDPDFAGPKYLNTSETAIFVKGNELFGRVEAQAELDRGAVPVLVEGPLDALAVTLAGEGAFVGIAPLGTAFTEAQADQLECSLPTPRPRVVVAADADAAGRKAAERMFWVLVERGGEPGALGLAPGDDPADHLRTEGPDSLRAALVEAPGMARQLINFRIDALAGHLDTVEGQVHATRRSAEIIAALPSSAWPELLTHVVVRTGIAPDIALAETMEEAGRREGSGASLARRPATEPTTSRASTPISAEHQVVSMPHRRSRTAASRPTGLPSRGPSR